MKQEVKQGQTDYTTFVLVRDTSGNAKTGLAFGDIDLAYARVETDNDVTTTDVAPADLTTPALTDPHLDWGFLEVSSGDHPGLYRLDYADAVFASGAWSAVVTLTGTGLEPSHMEFVLVPEAPYDGVHVNTLSADSITAAAIANAAIDNATFAADVGSTAHGTNIIALACRKILEELNLDHLLKVDTTVAADGDLEDYCVAGTIFAHLLAASADATDYKASTDSLEKIGTEIAKIGTIPALDGGAQTIGAAIGKLADDNGGATFNAGEDSLNKIRDDRTLAAADYVVVGDTIAGVTLCGTTTTNTDMRGTDGANTTVPDAAGTLAAYDPPTKTEMDAAHALLATEAKQDIIDTILDRITIALVNKMIITEANGNTEQFNDADGSLGSIAAAFSSDGTFTTRKRMVI